MDTTPHYSRVVPHPSTKRAHTTLTSEFGWDPVHFGRYGRIHWTCSLMGNWSKQLVDSTPEIQLSKQ